MAHYAFEDDGDDDGDDEGACAICHHDLAGLPLDELVQAVH